MLLKMAFFPSFLWLSNIPLCNYTKSLSIYLLMDIWLLPCLGYCKQCCYECWVHASFQIIEVLLSQGSHSSWLIKGRDFTLFSVILKYLPIVNHSFLVNCQPLAGRRSFGQQQHQDGTCRAEAGSPLAPVPQAADLRLWQLPVKKTRKFTPQIWGQWECPLLCLTPLPAIVHLDSLGWMPQLRILRHHWLHLPGTPWMPLWCQVLSYFRFQSQLPLNPADIPSWSCASDFRDTGQWKGRGSGKRGSREWGQ